MSSLLNYVIIFALGGGCVYGLTKKESSPKHRQKKELEQSKELTQLQINNTLLGVDKLNLQTRNSDLVQIIAQNQQRIRESRKDIRELKEDFRLLASYQITILVLLSSVTKIRDQADINAQIMPTKRLLKKYEPFLKTDENLNNSDISTSD